MLANVFRSLLCRRGSGGKTGTGTTPAIRQAKKARTKSREGRKTRRTRSPLRSGAGKTDLFLNGQTGRKEEEEGGEEEEGTRPAAIRWAREYVSAYVNEADILPLSSMKVSARFVG
jgi:hypothetical protein